MKSTSSINPGSTRGLRAAIILTVLALLSLPALTNAQSRSPLGAWDCITSGSRSGTTYMNFTEENGGSFSGIEVIVPRAPTSPRESLLPGNILTNGLGPQPPSSTNTGAVFGATDFNGTWGFDKKGRVVGNYVELKESGCTVGPVAVGTNILDNSADSISATNTVEGGYCITTPVATNFVAGNWHNVQTCYLIGLPLVTNTFVGTSPVIQTNVATDSATSPSLCITYPIGTNTADATITNQTSCYRLSVGNQVVIETPNPISTTNVSFQNSTVCIVVPQFQLQIPSSFVKQQICYQFQTNCTGTLTNVISFVGTVVPGKRLTLTCKSDVGSFTLHGTPSTTLQDLTGSWMGVRKRGGQALNEFMELKPLEAFPNTYLVSGIGPNYTYTNGIAMLSSQKKIGFGMNLSLGQTYLTTRAVVGSFNPRKLTGSTKGIDAAPGFGTATNGVTFQVNKRATVP